MTFELETALNDLRSEIDVYQKFTLGLDGEKITILEIAHYQDKIQHLLMTISQFEVG